MDAAGIKETLMTKIGPLPAVAWGGIFGGVYVVYRYYKASKSGAVDQASGANNVGDVGTADDFSQGFTNTTPGLGPTGATGTVSVGDTAPSDNSSWGTRAANWLISTGVSPTDAQAALGTYLYGTGQALNSTQSAALRSALAHFGSPPEGVILPPPTVPVPPIPKPPAHVPKPATMPYTALRPSAPTTRSETRPNYTYTVHPGDTLELIAAHFYGRSDASPFIIAANRLQTKLVKPGQTLLIPNPRYSP